MAAGYGIAVAGTHGKSTTVAMTDSILSAAGLDPTVVVGAEPVAARPLSRHGAGKHVLVEACEYRSSFLQLQPRLAAILNVEPDHFDYFSSRAHMEAEFARFARQAQANGTLIVSANCRAALRAGRQGNSRVLTFAIDCPADVCGRIVAVERGYYRFELVLHGRRQGQVGLPAPGRHNAANAVAAAAIAHAAGVDWPEIQAGLQAYSGLRRRMQTLGIAGGIVFVDDYAHHPTEISAVLTSIRELHPDARIWCVFEPHQASRTKSLLDELAVSLQNADTLAVAEICRAREPAWQAGEPTAADLAARICQRGRAVADARDTTEIHNWLLQSWRRGSLRTGDVVVTLGAGQIGTLAHGVYQRIRKDCANR